MSGGTPAVQNQSTPTNSPESPNQSVDPTQSAESTGAQGEDAQCPADPLEEFREALSACDSDRAWDAYTSLDDREKSQLSQSEIKSTVGLFADRGLAALQQVFGDFCIEVKAQIEMCDEEGVLDADLAFNLVNGGGVTAEEQKQIAEDTSLMSTLYALVAGDKKPHEFFSVLAAAQNDFVKACANEGPLADWVGQDDETLKAVVTGVPDYTEWSNTFQAHEAWDKLLKLAADDPAVGAQLRTGIIAGSGYSWIVDAAPQPIDDDTLANGLFEIYGDGSGINTADKYKTWDCLYTADLATTAGDHQIWQGTWKDGDTDHVRTQYWHAVAPNDDAMNTFFSTFKPIPRVQINLADKVLMCDYRYYEHTETSPDWTFFGLFTITTKTEKYWEQDTALPLTRQNTKANAHTPLQTSYYNGDSNAILMHSLDGAGTPSTGTVPNVGTGTGAGPSAANQEFDEHGNPVGGLRTYFENHAAHEVGHAVGNKRLQKDGINTTGDAAAQAYGGWAQNGAQLNYARQLGWTAAQDGQTFNLTVGATTAGVSGTDVRDYLLTLVGGAPVAATNGVVSNFSGNEMAAIQSDATLAAHLLVRTINSAGSAGESYNFLHGIPSAVGGKVHFWSSRWGSQWVTYNVSAWNERVSHYSVASPAEMFAEIYTHHYAGGAIPAGMQAYFNALDTAEAEHFPDHPAAGGGSTPGTVSDGAGGLVANNSPWP